VLPLPAWDLPWQLSFGSAGSALGLAERLGGLQLWAAFYLSLLILAIAAMAALVRLRRGSPEAPALLLLALLGLLLLRQALNRLEMVHVFPMALMALCLAGALPRLRAWGAVAVALRTGLLLALVCIPLLLWARYLVRLPGTPKAPSGPGVGLPVPADLQAATALVASATSPQSRIFVANADMGRGILNNVIFYFLAQRACSSFYVLIQRPLPKASVADILAGLQRPDTAAVVLWSGLGPERGQHPLDLALAGFGSPVAKLGDYEIRGRVGEPPAR
jgi:hypothetical protein